jgi:hypothetical protein
MVQYINAMATEPPAHFISPTIGSIIRAWIAPSNIWVQFLPTLLAMGWTVWYWRRHRDGWHWPAHLILPLFVAFLTTGYGGWPLDVVLLLPALVRISLQLRSEPSGRSNVALVAVYAAIQGILLFTHNPGTPQWTFVWLTPALLLLYLAARPVAPARRHLPDASLDASG